FGDFVVLAALVLYLHDLNASPAPLGAALACDLDRFCTLELIAVFLPPFPVLVLLTFTAGLFSAGFAPASRSAVPQLVERARLAHANSLLGVLHNVALALGPVAGALLFDHVGAQVAFGVNAVSYLLSTLFLTLLRPHVGSASRPVGASLRQATSDGRQWLAVPGQASGGPRSRGRAVPRCAL